MEFEWDRKKAKYNLRKHGVSFEEASSVFNDVLANVYEDPDHSIHEKRFLMIGTSARGHLLIETNALELSAHEDLPNEKRNSMKKKTDELDDEMRPEYDFSKLKLVGQGIYAKRYRSGTNLVLLDPDIRAAFPDDESVNEALRVIAKAGKQQAGRAKKVSVRTRLSTRTRRKSVS
jgi:uncharacterized DUF497 family protein